MSRRGLGFHGRSLPCSCRMSATQCLKHEWLNNLPAKAQKSKLRLKSQLLLQSYMAHRKWKVNTQRLANLLPQGTSAQHRQSHSLPWVGSLVPTGFLIVNISCEVYCYLKIKCFVLQKDIASVSSKFGFNFHSF